MVAKNHMTRATGQQNSDRASIPMTRNHLKTSIKRDKSTNPWSFPKPRSARLGLGRANLLQKAPRLDPLLLLNPFFSFPPLLNGAVEVEILEGEGAVEREIVCVQGESSNRRRERR